MSLLLKVFFIEFCAPIVLIVFDYYYFDVSFFIRQNFLWLDSI